MLAFRICAVRATPEAGPTSVFSRKEMADGILSFARSSVRFDML
jgi:hypothetical protein